MAALLSDAEIAEAGVRRPEFIIGYGAVEARPTSHEEGNVTAEDVEPASRVDDVR